MPVAAVQGKKVGMSRGPLTRGQAQLLVCMAKLAHIELIIKEGVYCCSLAPNPMSFLLGLCQSSTQPASSCNLVTNATLYDAAIHNAEWHLILLWM